jgi:hypothetical protein
MLVALRALGAGAIVPLSFGAAVAGAAWAVKRKELAVARAHTRQVICDGNAHYDRLWRRWLDGNLTRPARDLEIDLLIEALALRLADQEVPPQA